MRFGSRAITSVLIALCACAVFSLPGMTNRQQPSPSSPDQKKPLPDAPKPKGGTLPAKSPSEEGWPRLFTSGSDKFNIYQPQIDRWEGNQIHLYSAVELKTGKETAARYGVVWFQARTEVDKVNRLVTLDKAKVIEIKFPA